MNRSEVSEQLRYVTKFSFSEIKEATNNLDKSLKIGKGTFANVYKGFLPHTTVAIKIYKMDGPYGEAEFNEEAEVLHKVRHPNIITLIGICWEAHALICEYATNGNLADYLNKKKSTRALCWQTRIRIAFELCSVLIFLSSVPEPHGTAHGDIKSTNILLDSNYSIKLSGFGAICINDAYPTRVVPYPRGKRFYRKSLYGMSSDMTVEYDVEALGILILQLVTGRDPVSSRDLMRLVGDVQRAVNVKRVDEIIDSSAGKWPFEEATKLIITGLRCSPKVNPDLVRPDVVRPDLVRLDLATVWKEIESLKNVADKQHESSHCVQTPHTPHTPQGWFSFSTGGPETLIESKTALELEQTNYVALLDITKNEFEAAKKELTDTSLQLKSSLDIETQRRTEIEKTLEKERINHQKLEESKTAIELQLVNSKALLETTRKQHEELKESKAALELQLVNSKALLETTRKQHEEIQTALQYKLVESAKLMSSLDIETQRRTEIEKTLKKERISKTAIELELVNSKAFLETTRKQHEELHTTFQYKVLKSAKLKKNLEDVRIEQQKLLDSKAALERQVEQLQIERDNTLKNVKEIPRMSVENEFSWAELEEATHNFDNSCKIGEGAFGIVFKGFLRHTNVAIKMLKSESSEGDTEFHQEVEILTKVRHPNLVSLIGVNPNARALIFEFLPNSLDTFLTGGKNSELTWQDRIRIASEICSALIFLHSVPPHGIAHGDLKPQNILLDSNYVSKLCDFGISRKLYQSDETFTPLHLTTIPKFTAAYCAPEFFSSNELTPLCDIYSFGIILLQLVTGKDPIGIKNFVGEDPDNCKFDKLVVDSKGNWPIEEAEEFALLGMRCSHPLKMKRPNLGKVVWPSLESMKRVAGLC